MVGDMSPCPLLSGGFIWHSRALPALGRLTSALKWNGCLQYRTQGSGYWIVAEQARTGCFYLDSFSKECVYIYIYTFMKNIFVIPNKLC